MAAGVSWAIGVPLLAAVVVGVAVWVAKAIVAIAQAGRRPGGIEASGRQADWLARAAAAADRFRALAGSIAPGPLADRVALMGADLDDTIAALHRLAGQATLAEQALTNFNPAEIDQEHLRLLESRRTAAPEVAAEIDRSIAAVRTQKDVHDRLVAARDRALARMESSTLGLESLGARVVELSTISASDPMAAGGAEMLDQLDSQLEGLRKGLAETEEITRRALGPDLPPSPPG